MSYALRSPSLLWLRRWQVALNAVLLLAAVWIAVFVSRRGLFLIALLPLCFAPFSYSRLRLHRLLEHVVDRRRFAPVFLAAFFAAGVVLDAIMVGQLLTARAPRAAGLLHGDLVSWMGPVWFSAHALFVTGIGLLGLGRGVARLCGRLKRAFVGGDREAPPDGVSLERRRFLQQAGVLGAGAPFLVSFSGVKLSYDFRVEEREIVLPRWPRQLDGLRIVHLSDIHVGGNMNRQRLLTVAELTNRARPDLVLHTGDFLTHRSGDFDAPLYEALSKVRAPLGQLACLGNHDYDAPDRLVRGLQEAGVAVLRNRMSTVSVDGNTLEVGGVDFQFNRLAGDAYARVVSAWPRPDGVARLLLVHDPRAFATLPEECADLVLSGHTHGGHIGVQLGPSRALTIVALAGIPDQGIFRHGDLTLFVTRCVGFYGYPMRLGIPPEIAVLTVRSGDDGESA